MSATNLSTEGCKWFETNVEARSRQERTEKAEERKRKKKHTQHQPS